MPVFLARLLRLPTSRHAAAMIGGALAMVVVGGAVFAATQHIAVTTGWYWAVTTATTVGYGDVIPKNASGRLVASIVMVTAIPLLAGAFALFTGHAVANGVRRLLQMGRPFPPGAYRLVLGMHPAVTILLDELEHLGEDVVLVADVDPSSVPAHVHYRRGDPTSESAIRDGRPAEAAHVVIAAADDGDVVVSAVIVRQDAPHVPVTALVNSRRLVAVLKDLGVNQVLSPDDLTGHTVAKGLEAPHAGELLMQLVRGEDHHLAERVVGADNDARPLSAVREASKDLVLGVVQGTEVSLGIADDPIVRPGDLLLVVERTPAEPGDRGRRVG